MRQVIDVKMEARAWLERAREGYCITTDAGDGGDCGAGDKGSFPIRWGRHRGRDSEARALRECLLRCAVCERCIFLSFSLQMKDCSWELACRHGQLHTQVPSFRSADVNKTGMRTGLVGLGTRVAGRRGAGGVS